MKSSLSQILIISILLHAAVASAFVFTLKPKDQEHTQPILIFLGSILQRQDFGVQVLGGKTNFTSDDRSLRKSSGNLTMTDQVNKPSFEKRPEFRPSKIFIKTEFPEEKIEPT